MRFLYTLLLYLLLPRVLLHLWWRGRRQPAYREHIAERFGRFAPYAGPPLIWIHAVSVGETRAAEPLIRALQHAYPQHRILLTHMTPTGRETGRALYADSVTSCYLPYDFPFAVGAFLSHYRPVCGIVMETEIWPNLIHACHRRAMLLYLANARLSKKSQRRYARFSAFAATVLNEFTGIAAQSTADADRLRALGATAVTVTGNLKFDMLPDAALIERGTAWRCQWGTTRPVLLCASTREGEEALLLDSLRDADLTGLLVVIVPRHPQRFDEVAALLESRGMVFQRRSANQLVAAHTRVLLGDTMGEMFAYYAACDLAFIGGSLLPFGGQNLIEACAVGKPVLSGPHTYNFSQASQLAVACGAARRVTDGAELMQTVQQLFAAPEQMQIMSEAGLRFVKSNQGATERAMVQVHQVVA